MIYQDIPIFDVSGVLIDIDNTLYEYAPCHAQGLLQAFLAFEKIHLSSSSISYEEFKVSYRQKRKEVTQRLAYHGSCRSRLLAFQSLFEDLSLKASYNLALLCEDVYWNSFLQVMSPQPEAMDFLIRCKESQIQTCAVTDMQASIQIKKLNQLKVDKYIDFIVSSEEVGAEKPNPCIFKAALCKLKLKADQVIMIGDNEAKDIKGAQVLGIKGYQIKI